MKFLSISGSLLVIVSIFSVKFIIFQASYVCGSSQIPLPPGKANDVIDFAIKIARDVIKNNKLDPLKLPDFSTKIDEIKILYSVSLTDVYVRGLTTIKRIGNSSLYYKEKEIHLSSIITAGNLGITSLLKIRSSITNIDINVTISIQKERIKFGGKVNILKLKPKIDLFYIFDAGKPTIEIAPFDKKDTIINVLNRVITWFDDNIYDLVVKIINDHTDQILAEINKKIG